jgi:hypothetical protein
MSQRKNHKVETQTATRPSFLRTNRVAALNLTNLL